jgi:HlyD family secretion protein
MLPDGTPRSNISLPPDEAAILQPSSLQAIPIRLTPAYSSLRKTGQRGLLIVGTAIALLAALVGQTTIAGAVVSSGVLVVESGSKPVQHLSGGTVAAVYVRNGDNVTTGQPLIQLDQSSVLPRLTAAMAQLLQSRARLARLEAEREELAEVEFPQFSPDWSVSETEYTRIVATEREQFLRRGEQLAGQLNELYQRIKQAESQLAADEAQLAAVSQQRTLAQEQLDNLSSLLANELVPQATVANAKRELSQLEGTEGSLVSSVAAAKGRVAELKVTRIQVQRTWRTEVAEQIATTESAVTQLDDQAFLLQDQLDRLTIRAPHDGIVHELGTFGVGTVVQPGERMMSIVPNHDRLVGKVKIRPADIDQIYPGQAVTIQFSAFERATTPSAQGHLGEISADLSEDKRTGELSYSARIVPDNVSAFSATELRLAPGMPIEVFIRTDDRTILSYLAKPLLDQLNRAFR